MSGYDEGVVTFVGLQRELLKLEQQAEISEAVRHRPHTLKHLLSAATTSKRRCPKLHFEAHVRALTPAHPHTRTPAHPHTRTPARTRIQPTFTLLSFALPPVNCADKGQ